MKWNWDHVWNSLPDIFNAMWVTLGMTIGSFLFAMIFGFVWIFLRRIPFKPVTMLVTLILEFIRSTPPLVQLFFLFFALPPLIGLTLDPVTTGIIGLGVHFSTYISEIYRSGIESVGKGQWEAALALNFSTRRKWTKIILPQAIPPTIPMLGNYLIIMFKEVPLTATIGVAGMLHAAEAYGYKTFAFVEPYTIVALFFLLLSYPSALLVRHLERKFNRRFDKKDPTMKNSKIDKGVALNG